jgi:hypothetical protein
MNVLMADAVVRCVADAVVCEASLPDGEFGGEAMGETSLDESDGSFESLLRSEKQVDVVGHDDEGVEFVVSFGAIVLERFDEEFGVALDLKDAAAVVGSAGDKEGAGAGCAGGDRHTAIVTARTSGAKAPCLGGGCGTAEAVPLSKAVRALLECHSGDEAAPMGHAKQVAQFINPRLLDAFIR